ncbi:MAG: branched-chain amino acid ABC transporter permease [Desulfurococcales archaeon]|nr:branched-chain amino acid ABC transporter permease [Desulfurococcales archaeon]
MSLETLIVAIVDGIALGATLFMISSGLSLIFGLMGIVNFAHGSLFMLGAYIGYEVFSSTNSLALGLAAATASMSLLGGTIESGLLKRKSGDVLGQALITIGVMLLLDRTAWIIWGETTYKWVPDSLKGVIELGGIIFYEYRLFLIAFGAVIAAAVFSFLKYTNYGTIIRAAIEDREMVEALGIDVRKTFTITFILGSGLAGLGGAVLVPWLGVYPTLGITYLLYAFAIVVIGGIGSFTGTLAASLLVGVTQQLAAYYVPWLAEATIFILMLAVLLLRPEGLVRG